MVRGTDGSDPGRFSIQVPPPSANGARKRPPSAWDTAKRSVPAVAAGIVLALSIVPRRTFLAPFALSGWPAAVAALVTGLVVGLTVGRRGAGAAVAGASTATAAVLLASIPIRTDAGGGSAAEAAVDATALAAWSAWSGAIGGWAGAAARARARRRPTVSRYGR